MAKRSVKKRAGQQPDDPNMVAFVESFISTKAPTGLLEFDSPEVAKLAMQAMTRYCTGRKVALVRRRHCVLLLKGLSEDGDWPLPVQEPQAMAKTLWTPQGERKVPRG